MRHKRKRKLISIIIMVSGCAVSTSLVLYALRKNIDLYYTPKQALNAHLSFDTCFRLGGMVEKGSVMQSKKDLRVSFMLTDFYSHIKVVYGGVLPSLFREGQGIIARGHLTAHHVFIANQVLAKHDEKYRPPLIKDQLNAR